MGSHHDTADASPDTADTDSSNDLGDDPDHAHDPDRAPAAGDDARAKTIFVNGQHVQIDDTTTVATLRELADAGADDVATYRNGRSIRSAY